MSFLQVLGPVSLRLCASGESLPLGRKGQAALAWLATRAESPASRSALIDLLWGDGPQADPRNSLRQLLFQLRRLAAPQALVRAEGECLRIDPAACDVDLWRFLSLARSPLQRERLAACALYTGDLADGLDCTPSFDAWLAAEREHVRQIAASLVQRVTESWDGSGDVDIAAALARALLRTDPVREDIWASLIGLYEKAGRDAAAQSAREERRRQLRGHPNATARASVGIPPLPSPRLKPVPGRAPSAPPRPDEAAAAASDHLLRGLHYYFLGSAEANDMARDAFEAASLLDPSRAEAAVLAAWTHFTDFNFVWNGAPVANYLRAAAECRKLEKRFPGDPFVRSLDAKLRLWEVSSVPRSMASRQPCMARRSMRPCGPTARMH